MQGKTISYYALAGRVIARYRGDLGFSQADFAQKMGVEPSTWSKTERGITALSLGQLHIAAENLGLTPTSLFNAFDRAVQDVSRKGAKVVFKTVSTTNQTKNSSKDALVAAGALAALAFILGSR